MKGSGRLSLFLKEISNKLIIYYHQKNNSVVQSPARESCQNSLLFSILVQETKSASIHLLFFLKVIPGMQSRIKDLYHSLINRKQLINEQGNIGFLLKLTWTELN